MTTARRHHWVPQFYLKGFTKNGSKNSKLFAVDLKDRRTYWTSPAKVCSQRDFNRVEVEGLAPDALEAQLATFESDAAGALAKVIASASTTDDERAWLYVVNLMSMLAVRGPAMRANMEDFYTRIIEMMMDMQLSTPERWDSLRKRMEADGQIPDHLKGVTYEGLKKFVDEKQYVLRFPHGFHVPAEFGAQDEVLESLLDRKWRLVVAPTRTGGFLTSDQPLCLTHSDGSPPSLQRPLGHRLSKTTVYFPLSPQLLAVGSYEGRDGTVVGNDSIVSTANLTVAMYCDRQVYAPHDRFLVHAGTPQGFVRGSGLLALLEWNPDSRLKKRRGKVAPR